MFRAAPPRPAPSRPVQLAAVFATARARCSRPLSLWGGLMFSAVCYLLLTLGCATLGGLSIGCITTSGVARDAF